MKLLVLDGNSIVNRAFYGIKLLTTKDGRFTNAIVGFMNILLKLEAEEKPDEVAVAFDLKAPTFRHKMYSGYKAQRKGMPEELAAQLPVLKELLADLGYKMVTCEGYEADDILGTLAAACAARGDECAIATGDRDSLQLVGPHTRVLLAGTQMGRSVTTVMDEAAVFEKYGVRPRQLIEVKSLMGDASDNIPGVPGVGPKTAARLLNAFGPAESWLDDPARIGDPKLRARLEGQFDVIRKNRKLIALKDALPGRFDPPAPHLRRTAPDWAKIREICERMELRSVLKELPEPPAAPARPEAAEDDLFSFLASPAPEAPKPEPGMEQGELF